MVGRRLYELGSADPHNLDRLPRASVSVDGHGETIVDFEGEVIVPGAPQHGRVAQGLHRDHQPRSSGKYAAMTTVEKHPFRPDYAIPPGDTLRDRLAEMNLSQAELAARAGLSTKHVNQIMQGIAPITLETAIRARPGSPGFLRASGTGAKRIIGRPCCAPSHGCSPKTTGHGSTPCPRRS